MFLSDYHLHSSFSFDSVQTIEEIAGAAIKKEINEIAVTDHVELAAGNSAKYRADLLKAAETIDRVGSQWEGRLVIRKGMELGNAHLEPEEAKECVRRFSGDFIIGSVHNIEPEKDVAYYDYTKTDMQMVFYHYLKAALVLAETTDYDVLGHLTYPLKAMYDQTGNIPDMHKYTEQFRKIFQAVIGRGKGIEINTSGLRCRLGKLLPDEEILRLYRQCGGSCITVGSDAHRAQDTGEGIREAEKALEKLGFTEITGFENRKAVRRKIEMNCKGSAG